LTFLDIEKKRAYQNAWISRRRNEWITENGPCKRCGTWINLEVDHIDSRTKSIPTSRLWSMSKTNQKRIEELEKCQVLCNNCHKKKTYRDLYVPRVYNHGTTEMYNKKKCRCSLCKEAVKL
jgi:5-methylcytosine-specific restriction endonuclease McrA